jgi:hypothetical protein
VVCGPCWAAHGGTPAAGEIGPEPAETAPLRYPTSQRQWLAALRRAEWVEQVRVDGRRNLLSIARHLVLAADWETLESMPGWDRLMVKTGLSQTTIQRWVQELKLRGWLVVVETGSTPLTRPMALTLPDGAVLSRLDEVNRRAVYALRIPLSPDEALAWAAAESLAAVTGQGAQPPPAPAAGGYQAPLDNLADTGPDQHEPGCAGDKKGRPTWSFPVREKTWQSSYAREGNVVNNSSPPGAGWWGSNSETDALRARLDQQQGPNWAVTVPTSGFQMLIAADWLRRRLPVFARLTRKAVRAACRAFWHAGWTGLDIAHAMDHLPAAFGPRAHTPIGRGPADHLDTDQAWCWIRARLNAWRDTDGKPRRGYYQTRHRRKTIRETITTRHGRAALAVLDDLDLATDPTLTPEKITRFGRRVATQTPAQTIAARQRPPQPAPVASQQARAASTELLTATLAQRAASRAAAVERHAALMAHLAPQLEAARAQLAAQTGGTPAATPPPVTGPALTTEQRYEHACLLAAGYRRRRKPGPPTAAAATPDLPNR